MILDPHITDAVQMPHPTLEVSLWRMDQQMVMVLHDAIGMSLDPEHSIQLRKQFQKYTALLNVVEDESDTHHHDSSYGTRHQGFQCEAGEPWRENTTAISYGKYLTLLHLTITSMAQ